MNVEQIAQRITALIDAGSQRNPMARAEIITQRKQLQREWGRHRGGWRRTDAWSTARYRFLGRNSVSWQDFCVDINFFDHMSVWYLRHPERRDQVYAVSSHLYPRAVRFFAHEREIDHAADRAAALAFAARFDLNLEYPAFPSWHYPEHTVFLWWTRNVDQSLIAEIVERLKSPK